MKITKKGKRILLILLAMICLCIFICVSWPICQPTESPDATTPTETEPEPSIETEPEPSLTLEALLGESYVQFITDTVTMQMENRMVKKPGVRYYPVVDHAPLSNYVTINEQTQFELDQNGYLIILFPAGTVADPAHGEQRFRVLEMIPSGERIEIPDPAVDWKLLLVNPWNPLPDDFSVNLTQIGDGQEIDSRVYPDLQKMMDDARAEGLSPLICSSYRTTEMQESLYSNKIRRLREQGYSRERAETEAGRWVAVPGTSEHQLGLAVDIVAESYRMLDERQEKTAEQKWLMENAYRYGFILRYPADKCHLTGIGYEPWHYRYVGKEAAKKMYETGMCLEEYLDKNALSLSRYRINSTK
ncbi:MAG: M15 family metallopeptidase [Faecousia sp.]